MNYLAHLYLSGKDENLIIGNFIADSVRGSDMRNYSPEIQRGIILHRKIDSFTDRNALVQKSKERLRPYFHKYAPVIVDVFYDHFLAIEWKEYSSVPLREYCDKMYGMLKERSVFFPKRSKRFLYYLTRNDMLFRYSTISGVERTLQVLSMRARFWSGMHKAHKCLVNDFESYREEFKNFFPELKKEAGLEIH